MTPNNVHKPSNQYGPGFTSDAASDFRVVPVGLSTSSVYPEPTVNAFEIAAALGYDGMELMVWNDPVSQDIDAIEEFSQRFGQPILSIHAPCLVITQRVWSPDPWQRLIKSVKAAERLGASTVVVHPPFRWQRDYARDFAAGLARIAADTDVRIAVENMFPLRAFGREACAYAPHWDPSTQDFDYFTLDTSHTAVSRVDALEMADRMGERLTHIHLGDGTGQGFDEHMIPGRGDQPCGPLLERLAGNGFDGSVIVEVSTKRIKDRERREADLAEALAFARLHLAAPRDLAEVR